MLWTHPILQALVTLASCYVLWLGFIRFQSLHMNKPGPWPYMRHVRLGLLVIPLWFLGGASGAWMVKSTWYVIGITGTHHTVALIMIPFMVFGLGSGYYMYKRKKPRVWLPLAHGICNAVLVALALWQGITGVGIIRTFLMG